MHKGMYRRLQKLARAGQTATYSEIGDLYHLDMRHPPDRIRLATLLTEILKHEKEARRPPLAAIVVLKGKSNMPGKGFFSAMTKLRWFNGSQKPSVRKRFWKRECQRVFAFWAQRLHGSPRKL